VVVSGIWLYFINVAGALQGAAIQGYVVRNRTERLKLGHGGGTLSARRITTLLEVVLEKSY